MRAYLTNPAAIAVPGTLQATFDLPAGRFPAESDLASWRVRTWDARVVDVAWSFPHAPHPRGSVRTAVATWVDRLAAGVRRQRVEMVSGTNQPPAFTLTAAAQNFVDNGELWINYTDLDPVWAADGSRTWTSRSSTEVSVDVLAHARTGALQGRPGRRWDFTQHGLVRVYYAVTSIGPGAHNDWMGNTVQGLLYVHTWVRVASGQDDAQLQFLLANTAQFPTPGSRPVGDDARPTRPQGVDRSLCRSLHNLRCRVACNGLVNLQMRPWAVQNYTTGEGPAAIRSIDGVGFDQGKEWALNIEGLRRPGRYPFFFAVAWGLVENVGGGIRAHEQARHPACRNGWAGVAEHTQPLRIGAFAGDYAAYGFAAGGHDVPPPDIATEIQDEWHNGAAARYSRFLLQQEGFVEWTATIRERPNDPWNLLGYPADPGQQGGDHAQIYWNKAGRLMYGNSPEELVMQAFKAARFHAGQLGAMELRAEERAQTRNPGSIPHTVPSFNWGERDTILLFDASGPHFTSAVQFSMRSGNNSQARVPAYPIGSTNPAQWWNPDHREQMLDQNPDPLRWRPNGGEHWGVARMTECVRAAPSLFPVLEHLIEKHAENAYFALPDGFYYARGFKANDAGSSPRLKKRFWRTLRHGSLLTRRQDLWDRVLEQIWRIENDGSGNRWQPVGINSNSRGEIGAMRLNGDSAQTYDMRQHVHFAWQSALLAVELAIVAYETGAMTGATPAYPTVSDLRESASEIAARSFRAICLRLIRDCFGIPATRLGLTPRLLDNSVDWSLPRWGFGLMWHRLQGFGAETPLGEGGDPPNLNRVLGGQTGGGDEHLGGRLRPFGPDQGATGEESDIYVALIASKVWDSDPEFTADIRARRDYLIGRIETLMSGLRTGRDYEAKGNACGGGGGGGVGFAREGVQTPSIGVSVEPMGGTTPLDVAVTIGGFAPGDPASYSVRVWWDWFDGAPATPHNESRTITQNGFTLEIRHRFEATTSAQRIYSVRAELVGPTGPVADARAQVEVNAVPIVAGFEILGASGYAPVEIGIRNRATGTITRISYEIFNETNGSSWTVEGSEPSIDLAEIGVYTFTQRVEGPSGTRTAIRERAIEVSELVMPVASATVSPRSGTGPLAVVLTNTSNLPGTVYFGTGQELPSDPGKVHHFTYSTSGTFQVTVAARNRVGNVHAWTATVTVDLPAPLDESSGELPILTAAGVLPTGQVRTNRTSTSSKGTLKPIEAIGVAPNGTLRKGSRGTIPVLTATGAAPDGRLGSGVTIRGELIGAVGVAPDGEVSAGSTGTLPPIAAVGAVIEGRTRRGARLVQNDSDVIYAHGRVLEGRVNLSQGVRIVGAPISARIGGDGRVHRANNGGTIAYIQQGAPISAVGAVPPGRVFGSITGLQVVRLMDALLVRERNWDARIPAVQVNITGYVVGAAELFRWRLKDGSQGGNNPPPIDPRELRNAHAKLHIFRTNNAEVPFVTLDLVVEPYADGGPTVSRQMLRADTTGRLSPNSTYWYRVEVETEGSDRDVPVVWGDFSTAAQPAMVDDVAV